MPLFTRLLAGAAPLALAATAVHADVVISSDATQNMSCNAGVCAPTADDAVLNVSDLETLLASGNIEVTAYARHIHSRNMLIESAINSSSPYSLTLEGNHVNVQKAISMQGAGGISLNANSLTIKAQVSISGSGALAISCSHAHIYGAVSTQGTSSLSIYASEMTIERALSIQGSGTAVITGFFLFGPKGGITFTDLSVSPTINYVQYALVNSLPTLAAAIAANPSGKFALANPYDAGADGTYSASPITTNFLGSLEGLGNTISNISVNNNASCCVGGLFQSISGGSVANVRLKNVSVASVQGAAGLAYESFGAITGSSVTGSVSGSGAGDIGGLVADNYGAIENSYSTAAVSAGSMVDGINVGGLVGVEYGSTQGSFATGAVSAGNGSGNIGGLTGEVANAREQNSPQNCYATGNVSGGSGLNVGGLIGMDDFGSGDSSVSYCYSTGAVSGGGGSIIGGLIGTNNSFLSDNYWDTTTSGTDVGVGLGNASGITGLTTAQLQSGLPAGFQPNVWQENAKINNGLPYLTANPPPN